MTQGMTSEPDLPCTYIADAVFADRTRIWQPGSVTIAHGRLVMVGPEDKSGRVVDLRDQSAGYVVICPSFVNAHTHLDLSDPANRPPAPDPTATFADWLHQVVAFRRDQARLSSGSPLVPDYTFCLAELRAAGSMTVADISGNGSTFDALAAAGFEGGVYHEILGLRPPRIDAVWQQAADWLAMPVPNINRHTRLQCGLSVHAPYSADRTLYERALATGEQTPTRVTHWLESVEERELWRHQHGPLRAFLEELGAWPEGYRLPVDPWDLLRAEGARWTLVHGGQILPSELDWLASPEGRRQVAGLVYCPRTHQAFGRGPHPWFDWVQRGLSVGLGTDSRASNPDLNVWREACFVFATDRNAAPKLLLHLLTAGGAEALGWHDAGHLWPGSSVRCLTVRTPNRHGDIWDALLQHENSIAVME